MLNKSFDRKFSEEQFSTFVFFHKNANLARYLQKLFFGWFKPLFKKKAAGGYCDVLLDTIVHHFRQSDLCPHSLHFFL